MWKLNEIRLSASNTGDANQQALLIDNGNKALSDTKKNNVWWSNFEAMVVERPSAIIRGRQDGLGRQYATSNITRTVLRDHYCTGVYYYS